MVWRVILSNEGLVNYILERIGLGDLTMMWLANKYTPIFMVALVQVWQWTGFNMVFYLAALHAVPEEQIDAARIDGASWFQTVKNVITPYITPVVTIVVIINIISSFRVFDLVYVMTKGGPGRASEVISTYIVWMGFGSDSPNLFGYASTMSMYLILITAFFVFARIRLTRRAEEEM